MQRAAEGGIGGENTGGSPDEIGTAGRALVKIAAAAEQSAALRQMRRRGERQPADCFLQLRRTRGVLSLHRLEVVTAG
ncbi:hypothetical protein GCM10008942_41970 [Rhizomicrobium electricum]|uniref:Uncharacterized protein n=1 Tax=Rhizomicrobium electricum TaxID=480070 RepID=A0ABN1FDH9_9PROT